MREATSEQGNKVNERGSEGTRQRGNEATSKYKSHCFGHKTHGIMRQRRLHTRLVCWFVTNMSINMGLHGRTSIDREQGKEATSRYNSNSLGLKCTCNYASTKVKYLISFLINHLMTINMDCTDCEQHTIYSIRKWFLQISSATNKDMLPRSLVPLL